MPRDTFDKVKTSALYDVFGGTLTAKQREFLELYCFDDLSLSEIAENASITASGAHDIVSRATAKLRRLERETGVAEKLGRLRSGLADAAALADGLPDSRERGLLIKLLSEVSDGV
ncbi:MAG: DNA-binding protein [Oscillospiraceae bacterium]|jgi:predicted DNA-binding protein YlxM (UPF0122 family)|nr:DNA-binding protein [Oscillospiraceae bacterium]